MAQCRLFTDEADKNTETWRAFATWASNLRQSGAGAHSVVTFNYDRVPEMLEFDVIDPSLNPIQIEQKRGSLLVPVFKLHGGVDWRVDANGVARILRDGELDSAEDVAIAVPGRSKTQSVREWFKPLWTSAVAELRQADSVVFVGYRFPESDVEAMALLLGALRRPDDKPISAHVVLGPSVNSPDIVRLKTLLTYALSASGRTESPKHNGEVLENGQFRVVVHPLFA